MTTTKKPVPTLEGIENAGATRAEAEMKQAQEKIALLQAQFDEFRATANAMVDAYEERLKAYDTRMTAIEGATVGLTNSVMTLFKSHNQLLEFLQPPQEPQPRPEPQGRQYAGNNSVRPNGPRF